MRLCHRHRQPGLLPWFGTNAGGASRFKDGKWKTYFPMRPRRLLGPTPSSTTATATWIGTWAGANQFNVKTGKFKTYVKELINEWVYGLAVDPTGASGSVPKAGFRCMTAHWKKWNHEDGLGAANAGPASRTTGLGTRSRHDLTTQVAGMDSYNPNYVFSILARRTRASGPAPGAAASAATTARPGADLTTKDGLAGNIVYAIARDASGVFWFGTDNGVSRYDEVVEESRPPGGLLDNHVYAVAVTLTAMSGPEPRKV
jgi:hypothetical protein